MRLHLPLKLRSVLIASMAAFVGYASTIQNASADTETFGIETISINFVDGRGEITSGNKAGAVPVAADQWYQTSSQSGSTTLGAGLEVSWSSANLWSGGTLDASNGDSQLFRGYLDDGRTGATIDVSGLDAYSSYDVYIYCNTDTRGASFLAKTVNGVSYTYVDGELVEGTSVWGSNADISSAVVGTNVMQLSGLSGDTLTINGGVRDNSNRGGISGIQINYGYTGEKNIINISGFDNWTASKVGDAVWADVGPEEDRFAAFVSTGDSTVKIADGDTRTTDAVTLESGNLLIMGGTLSLSDHGFVRVADGSTLTVSSVIDGRVNLLGNGDLVLQGEQSVEDLKGSGNLILDDNAVLTITGSEVSSYTGSLALGEGASINVENDNWTFAGTMAMTAEEYNSGIYKNLTDTAALITVTGDEVIELTFESGQYAGNVNHEGGNLVVRKTTDEIGTIGSNGTGIDKLIIEGGYVRLTAATAYRMREVQIADGAQFALFNATTSLPEGVKISMGADSRLHVYNGQAAAPDFVADIVIDAKDSQATILGSYYGSSTDIAGTITGEGTLRLTNIVDDADGYLAYWGPNKYEVSATISDKEDGGALGVLINAEGGTFTPNITISGTNTYTGGTTIEGGAKVTLTGEQCFGTGDVVINGSSSVTINSANAMGPGNVLLNAGSSIVVNHVNGLDSVGLITMMGGSSLSLDSTDMESLNLNVHVDASATSDTMAYLIHYSGSAFGGSLTGDGTLMMYYMSPDATTFTLDGDKVADFKGNIMTYSGIKLSGDMSAFEGTVTAAYNPLVLGASSPIGGTLVANGVLVESVQSVSGMLKATSITTIGSALQSDVAILDVASLSLGSGTDSDYTPANFNLNMDSMDVALGEYTLVTWENLDGSFIDVNEMGLSGDFASLYKGTFTLDEDGKALKVTLEESDSVVTWDGTPLTDVGSDITYKFDGSHSGDAVIDGAFAPGAMIFTNGEGQDIVLSNGTGELSGTGSITKAGAGVLTFASANENYSGNITVREGTAVLGAAMAMGQGNVTVEEAGTIELTVAGESFSNMFAKDALTVNGGTVSITESSTLDSAIQGSQIKLNISGADTVVDVTAGQKYLELTTVDGATVNLSQNSDGDWPAFYGTVVLKNQATLNSTDSILGKETDGQFESLTLKDSTWNVGGTNCSMSNATIILDNSDISVATGMGYGIELYSGTNTFKTEATATGMSTIKESVAGTQNRFRLSGGSAIFDIARGSFELDETNTSDLKVDVYIDGKVNLDKRGDGVLELSSSCGYTSKTLIQEGTLLMTEDASLGYMSDVILGGIGDATLIIDLAQDSYIMNTISGDGTLIKRGDFSIGMYNYAGDNTFTGKTVIEGGTLTAWTATALGASSVLIDGGVLNMGDSALTNDVTLSSGTLTGTSAYAGSGIVVDVAAGKTATLQNVDPTVLSSITLVDGAVLVATDADGALTDLDLSAVDVTMKLGVGNVIVGGSEASAMIDASSLTLSGATAEIDLSNEALLKLLTDASATPGYVKLLLSTGDLNFDDASATLSPVLQTIGYKLVDIDGGALVVTGNAGDVYLVSDSSGAPTKLTDYTALDDSSAVVLDAGKTLSAELNGAPEVGNGLEVSNLIGLEGSSLNVTNTDTTEEAVVLLKNAVLNPELNTGIADPSTVGTDTLMQGSIIGGEAVTFIKEGVGTLTVDGKVDVDTLKLAEGDIALGADDNSVNALVGDGGSLTVKDGAKVTLREASALSGDASVKGDGTLSVASSLEMSGNAALAGTTVDVADGASLKLSNAATRHIVNGLSGKGTLDMNGGALNVNGSAKSVFSGTLAGKGTLALTGGSQTLRGAGSADYSLSVNGGELILDSAEGVTSYKGINVAGGSKLMLGSATAPNSSLQVGADGLIVQSGASLGFTVDASTFDDLTTLMPLVESTGNIVINRGASLVIDNLQLITVPEADELAVTLMTVNGGSITLGSDINLTGAAVYGPRYEDMVLKVDGNNLMLVGSVKKVNAFLPLINSANSGVAADMLWASGSADGRLQELYNGVWDMQTAGDLAGARKAMTAATGSTVTSLVISQRDALRNQMGWIRNRVAQMGANPNYINEELPYFHMWMQATGSTASLDTDSDESGYDLNTWGGTFGVDVDLSDSFTAGLAFTASYGDLSASAADTAEGDVDSYYLNMFARYQSKQWSHLFVMTAGWSDSSLTRTVNYGAGSYQGEGDSSGFAFGLMYELAYDIALNEDKTAILQPLFNLSMVSANMGGYNESGTAGNAGLHVGDMDMVTGTVAVGARLTGLVGSNIFGREALGEVRVNIAQDFGDRQGEAKVGYLGAPGATGTILGAEEGATAIQLGVGLSVPVGNQGIIYFDGNADLRSGSTSLNGSIGYRYDF